ncbi:MAG TPA: hypothetical protein VEY10_13660 [Flavisolibacter sp.]|jgi:hypothetical protein|nr:hypothetical protein [Flavisolibacter sp.]
MARKPGLPGLLLAGAAAYGLYKLSKLSTEERTDLVNKGKKLVTDNIPKLKNALGGSTDEANATNGRVNNFSEEVTYGG